MEILRASTTHQNPLPQWLTLPEDLEGCGAECEENWHGGMQPDNSRKLSSCSTHVGMPCLMTTATRVAVQANYYGIK